MSSSQHENDAQNRTHGRLRLLTPEELESFREDYRELEKEIQSFFRAYYLSGLVLVAAWLIGPQSRPLLEIVLGNSGYNIYAPIAIAALNMASATYLIYKSIAIHNVSQFMAYSSQADSAFNYWESWRRNKWGAEYYARYFYAPLLVLVPLGLSCALLYATYNVINTDPQVLVETIKKSQPPSSSDSVLPTTANKEVQAESAQKEEERQAGLERKADEERRIYAKRIEPILSRAKFWFWLIVVLHFIPFLLMPYLSLIVTNKDWKRIRELRGTRSLFQDLNPKHSQLSFPKKVGKTIVRKIQKLYRRK